MFKLVPRDERLINIAKDFNDYFLPVSFADSDGVKLDSSKGIFNVQLNLYNNDVLEHSGWLTALEEDRVLLKDYRDLTRLLLKEKFSRDTGMGFYVYQKADQDQLRALFVNSLDDNSYAIGSDSLSYDSVFLRKE